MDSRPIITKRKRKQLVGDANLTAGGSTSAPEYEVSCPWLPLDETDEEQMEAAGHPDLQTPAKKAKRRAK